MCFAFRGGNTGGIQYVIIISPRKITVEDSEVEKTKCSKCLKCWSLLFDIVLATTTPCARTLTFNLINTMESKMKAAVVEHACDPADKPCKLEQVRDLEHKFSARHCITICLHFFFHEPKDDEILMQMVAIGVCHTDVHAIAGDWDGKATFPLVPGHEGIGVITKTGDGVKNFKIGDRVGISWLYSACEECEFCNTGRETICPHQKNTGFNAPGCMSEFAIAKAAFAVPIPQSLSNEDAARKYMVSQRVDRFFPTTYFNREQIYPQPSCALV